MFGLVGASNNQGDISVVLSRKELLSLGVLGGVCVCVCVCTVCVCVCVYSMCVCVLAFSIQMKYLPGELYSSF